MSLAGISIAIATGGTSAIFYMIADAFFKAGSFGQRVSNTLGALFAALAALMIVASLAH